MGHGPCGTLATFARGNKFTMVAVEYFTRWIEAKPLTTITLGNSEKVLLTEYSL
jgi:hypothetical protein